MEKLTRKEWNTWDIRTALTNPTGTPWCLLTAEQRKLFRRAELAGGIVELFGLSGNWLLVSCSAGTNAGQSYRISPVWPGPAEEPAEVAPVEYEDQKVVVDNLGMFCMENGWRMFLSAAIANKNFAGYVYPDGSIRSRLHFRKHADGTFRLIVPKAVRFVKEAAK